MALTDIVNAVSTDSNLAGVTVQLGAEFVPENGVIPPRVIFVPRSDRYDAARKHGAGPRTLMTKSTLCRIHVWGAGADADVDPAKHLRATELLVDRVIWAIHKKLWGSYSVEGGEWDGEPGLLHLGRLYLLDVRFNLPVIEPVPDSTTAIITDVNDVTRSFT